MLARSNPGNRKGGNVASVWTEYFQQQMFVNAEAPVVSPGLAGALAAAKIEIFTNAIGLLPTTTYADLIVPTYSGYAAKTATFAAPFRRQEGGIGVNSAFVNFFQASTLTDTQVYGFMCTDGATPPNLLFAELIPNGPISLIDALDHVAGTMQAAIGGPDFGSGDYSN
jgi:hypothetical protein